MAEPKTEEDKVRELRRLKVESEKVIAKYRAIHSELEALAKHYRELPRPSR